MDLQQCLGSKNSKNIEDRLNRVCEDGYIDLVKAITSLGIIQKYDTKTLYYACKGGNIEAIKLIMLMCRLTNKSTDIKTMWIDGLKGICECKRNNDSIVDIFKLFVKKVPELDHWYWKEFVKSACNAGNLNLTKFILNQKQSATNFEHNINQGLLGACYGGNLEIAKFMLSQGAYVINKGLIAACINGHIGVMELMISEGAADWDYSLVVACGGGHIGIVEFMISKGSKNFRPSLIAACRGGHTEIVNLMIKKIEKIEKIKKEAMSVIDWDNGLIAACDGGNMGIVEFMIENGATNWTSGLRSACNGGHLKIVEFMETKGAVMSINDFEVVCQKHYVDIIKHYVLNYPENLSLSLLHTCRCGFIEIAELIISEEKKYDNIILDLNKALVASCRNGYSNVAKLLINKGASDWGKSLDVACKYDHIDCVRLILMHGKGSLTVETLSGELSNSLYFVRSVEVVVELINEGAVADVLDILRYQNSKKCKYYQLYRSCCVHLQFMQDKYECTKLIKKYPPYVLFINSRSKSNTRCSICRLPVELFRLLFKYL